MRSIRSLTAWATAGVLLLGVLVVVLLEVRSHLGPAANPMPASLSTADEVTTPSVSTPPAVTSSTSAPGSDQAAEPSPATPTPAGAAQGSPRASTGAASAGGDASDSHDTPDSHDSDSQDNRDSGRDHDSHGDRRWPGGPYSGGPGGGNWPYDGGPYGDDGTGGEGGGARRPDFGQPQDPAAAELRREAADAFCDDYRLPRQHCEQAANSNGR